MSELFGFIQTPEIVDIEKYILQKPGMRDSSESNNGLHGSITTRKREFQLSSLNVLVTKTQDSVCAVQNIRMSVWLGWNENGEIQVEKKFNLFCKFLTMLLLELWHFQCDKIE